MRYTYIRPFVEAAQTILEQVLSDRSVAREPELSSRTVASRGVATLVGITGEAEGRLLLDMSYESAIQVAQAMNGEHLSQLDALGQDTIAELTSMITGRAITILNDAGHRLKVSPPTVLMGEHVTITGRELETLVVPLQTRIGEIVVNVAVTTN